MALFATESTDWPKELFRARQNKAAPQIAGIFDIDSRDYLSVGLPSTGSRHHNKIAGSPKSVDYKRWGAQTTAHVAGSVHHVSFSLK
jgi:hypothetical protein